MARYLLEVETIEVNSPRKGRFQDFAGNPILRLDDFLLHAITSLNKGRWEIISTIISISCTEID